MSTTPLLISFKLCPFVQRSLITLEAKNVAYDVEYIDLQNKPDWFLELSPLGKVPVLKIGETVLFESAVINEYLDEIYGPSFHPADPLRKAHNRAWIEFGSSLLMDQYGLFTASDAASFAQKQASLTKKLAQAEAQLGEGPYFNGQLFSLVDTAYAPLLMRFALVEQAGGPQIVQGKLRQWSDALLARRDVQHSVPEDFSELLLQSLTRGESYLGRQLHGHKAA